MFTAEQVEACIVAYRNGDLNYCRAGIIDLLTAYAATLRQSADSGRVGDDVVELFKAAFAEHSTISPGYDGCVRAALEAALAAQGQGEPVAWLCEWTDEGDGETVRVAFEFRRGAENRAAEVGGDARVIPLFTHPTPAASPAGVPDGWLSMPREALMYVSDLLAERKYGTPARSPAHNARIVVDYWLAAAPSAPEGDGGAADDEVTWVFATKPGCVPVRKGPLKVVEHIEAMLRDLYRFYPGIVCSVVETSDRTLYPQSGVEWLSMYGTNPDATQLAQQPTQPAEGE